MYDFDASTGMRSGEDESGLASKNVAVLTSAKETKTNVRITAGGDAASKTSVIDMLLSSSNLHHSSTRINHYYHYYHYYNYYHYHHYHHCYHYDHYDHYDCNRHRPTMGRDAVHTPCDV
jgi:hypothetical protein